MTTSTTPTTAPAPAPPIQASPVGGRGRLAVRIVRTVGPRLVQLVVLLFVISTVLFFLLRLGGDPARILAGENATPQVLDTIRAHYGLDGSLLSQYVTFVGQLVRLDFGSSLTAGQPALGMVLDHLPATLELALYAVVLTSVVAIPLGTWIGARPATPARRSVSVLVSIAQGIPGFVVGLLLIQVFSVELGWLPSVAGNGPTSAVLPALTLAAFLIPQMVRVVAASTGEAMRQDYVRTAMANGARRWTLLTRHALPNALLGTTALLGSQFAFLLSGALLTEYIFAWPGMGQLLVFSVTNLDFPVVQASVFVVALLVFVINTIMDVVFATADPRIRRRSA